MQEKRIERITLNLTSEEVAMFEAVASHKALPISTWARMVLVREARREAARKE